MTQEPLIFSNGQAWDTASVPVYEQDTFRQKVLDACRTGARLVNLFGVLEDNGNVRVCAFLGYDERSKLAAFSTRIFKENPEFPSLTTELAEAHCFEREIAEQFAINPVGHPWLKPIRYHGNYRNVPDFWPGMDTKPIPGDYPFFKVKGEEVHEVAVGPVHAGVIEPGHFRFQCHGERVLHLEIQLGYQHRGIEKMMETLSLDKAVLVAESIAGDTVIGHGTAYCSCLEALSQTEISPRAEALRAIALELERLSNHAGDLGSLSSDIGFLPSASHFGRLRGDFLNLLLSMTGNRFGRGLCRPGGVLFDLDASMREDFRKRLLVARREFNEMADLFFSKPSVLARLEGLGALDRATAQELGIVGPAARACGLARDVRTDHAFGIYRFLHLPVSLAEDGDVFARAQMRWLEASRSIDFILELMEQMPEGELLVPLKPLRPEQMALSLVEGWRGEIAHVVMTDARGHILRYKIKDPSFHNWMGLAMAMRGGQISDFPLYNKSFNLSYAGHDL